jgi:hypothetical protein
MAKLSNILRLLLHLALFLFYGIYLKEIISFPFLLISFALINSLIFILYRIKLRSLAAIPIILLFPWSIRLLVILINLLSPSFLHIFFDMNFYLILIPLYISALFSWFSLLQIRFRKYEVLLNGFFLLVLFWKQGNYKITLVPNPAYLAVFTILFLIVELLVLYLSISME